MTSMNLTDRALSRLQGMGSVAVISLVAATSAPAHAVPQVEPSPSITLDRLMVTGHNASGWFTPQPVAGSVGGQAYGALDEGFKLHGSASLPASQYMFNTEYINEYGWRVFSSYRTGVGLAWSGQAFGLQAEQRDEQTGDLLSAGDKLVFNYEFTLQGAVGTSYRLSAGFTYDQPRDQKDYDYSVSHTYASFGDGQITGYLESPDPDNPVTAVTTTFKGTFVGQTIYYPPYSDNIWWFVELTADSPYGTTTDLLLTVPTHSIDVGINTAPVPEPFTWSLALAGLGVGGLMARRRGAHRHA